MTTEKQFYEWAGIEPEEVIKHRDDCFCEDWIRKGKSTCLSCSKYHYKEFVYPPITDSIILGLINITTKMDYTFNIFRPDMFTDKNKYVANLSNSIRHDIYGKGNTLKNAILNLIMQLPELKPQVQELFRKD